jgi:sialidase-1
MGRTGRVLLMYQRYPPGRREHNVVPGLTGTNVCTSWITQSDDDGVSWSAPRDLTVQLKRATATSLASGPGIGIELRRGPHAGRLIMPFNEGPAGKWRVFAAFSDDGGATWKSGDPAPNAGPGHGNEVQMAELDDGAVLLNARNQDGAKLRKVATSRDGGATWSPLADDPHLQEPVCQASLLRHPNTGAASNAVLLFCNPASQRGRTNGVVRLSRDAGRTWPVSRVIYPGSFAYSCMAPLPDGSVALLFERDNCSRIAFCRFTPAWLAGGTEQP